MIAGIGNKWSERGNGAVQCPHIVWLSAILKTLMESCVETRKLSQKRSSRRLVLRNEVDMSVTP